MRNSLRGGGDGYGVIEATIIKYATNNGTGLPQGSLYVSQINRTSDIWLMGDVGIPQVPGSNPTIPNCTYKTWFATWQSPSWAGQYNTGSDHQAAPKHDMRANSLFVDGHIQAMKYFDLSNNVGDIWGTKGF